MVSGEVLSASFQKELCRVNCSSEIVLPWGKEIGLFILLNHSPLAMSFILEERKDVERSGKVEHRNLCARWLFSATVGYFQPWSVLRRKIQIGAISSQYGSKWERLALSIRICNLGKGHQQHVPVTHYVLETLPTSIISFSGMLELPWISFQESGYAHPFTCMSSLSLVAWNWPRRDYLHHRNLEKQQIRTPPS